MSLQCGIVGLPNVGKSTFFNALTATAAAQAANYPFCTIEPNVGNVAVPDVRLDELAKIGGSQKTVHAQLEFVDIAGLVKGASQGQGLGNQFLANIRETDAILHVLRCFEDEDITHVEGSTDPIRDAEIIETELMIADLESLERQVNTYGKKAKGGDKDAKEMMAVIEPIKAALEAGKPARTVSVSDADKPLVKRLQLLTAKPQMYVCNVKENDAVSGNAFTAQVAERAKLEGAEMVIICAQIEADIAQIDDAAEKAEFLETMGLTEAGLNRVIRAAYQLLGLQTYFTVGPKEARAWTIPIGCKAPGAAGVIHSDFERGFIKAEVIAFADFKALGSESAAKEQGKMRQEGKEYIVKDGDVILFRFNV